MASSSRERIPMSETFEKLTSFFEKIKNVTFWGRILPWLWNPIRILGYDAYSEFQRLVESIVQTRQDMEQTRNAVTTLQRENENLKVSNSKLENETVHLREDLNTSQEDAVRLRESLASRDEIIRQWTKNLNEKEKEIAIIKDKLERLSREDSELKQDIAVLKESEEIIRADYEKKIETLDRTQKKLEDEREQERKEQHQAEIQKITSMKERWSKHQENVRDMIKGICRRHQIEYVDKTPFKGSPDNTIKICDEYLVFDAKSPGTEDLTNFPAYIKTQTEAVKKYVKETNVKPVVFLVIPSNTVEVIKQFAFNMADYNVYIVTVDVLEPLILELKKVEDYEFIKELSPEERENICRLIGKFAHTTKRRIQIDHFFARQFLEILTKCETDVPKDMLEKAVEFEKSEKLNPPQEKRAKQTPSKDLVNDTAKLKREIEAKAIIFPDSVEEGLKALPLYDEEPQEG